MQIGLFGPLVAGADADIGLHDRRQADEVIQHVDHRAHLLLLPASRGKRARSATERVVAVIPLDFRAQAIGQPITQANGDRRPDAGLQLAAASADSGGFRLHDVRADAATDI